MTHAFPTGVILLLGALTLGTTTRNMPKTDRLVLWGGFLAHTLSAFAMLWIIVNVYDGIGDALTYMRQGAMVAAYVEMDPARHGADLASLIFHGSPSFPFAVHGIGRSTGTMVGLAAVSLLFTESQWAVSLLFSYIAFSGQVALFIAVKRLIAAPMHLRAGIACLLLPSVVFWTSGVQKEALMLAGLGWSVLGLSSLRMGRRLSGLGLTATGLATIGLVKPYVLFPLVVGVAVWVYWQKAATRGARVQVRPMALIAAALAAGLGIVFLSRLFPAYSLDNIGETVALQQHYGRVVGGGSFVEVGDPNDRSLLGQVGYAPFALVSALFRPFIFEVSNALMLINATETSLLTVLLVRAFLTLGPRGLWRRLWASPVLFASSVFVILLGTGVGLGTTNLGTLSRYRIPMMPFFAMVLLLLNHQSYRRAPVVTRRSKASHSPRIEAAS